MTMKCEETSIYQYKEKPSVDLKQALLRDADLAVGDRVTLTSQEGEIRISKKYTSFEQRWLTFFDQGGDYEDLSEMDWGEGSERELW